MGHLAKRTIKIGNIDVLVEQRKTSGRNRFCTIFNFENTIVERMNNESQAQSKQIQIVKEIPQKEENIIKQKQELSLNSTKKLQQNSPFIYQKKKQNNSIEQYDSFIQPNTPLISSPLQSLQIQQNTPEQFSPFVPQQQLSFTPIFPQQQFMSNSTLDQSPHSLSKIPIQSQFDPPSSQFNNVISQQQQFVPLIPNQLDQFSNIQIQPNSYQIQQYNNLNPQSLKAQTKFFYSKSKFSSFQDDKPILPASLLPPLSAEKFNSQPVKLTQKEIENKLTDTFHYSYSKVKSGVQQAINSQAITTSLTQLDTSFKDAQYQPQQQSQFFSLPTSSDSNISNDSQQMSDITLFMSHPSSPNTSFQPFTSFSPALNNYPTLGNEDDSSREFNQFYFLNNQFQPLSNGNLQNETFSQSQIEPTQNQIPVEMKQNNFSFTDTNQDSDQYSIPLATIVSLPPRPSVHQKHPPLPPPPPQSNILLEKDIQSIEQQQSIKDNQYNQFRKKNYQKINNEKANQEQSELHKQQQDKISSSSIIHEYNNNNSYLEQSFIPYFSEQFQINDIIQETEQMNISGLYPNSNNFISSINQDNKNQSSKQIQHQKDNFKHIGQIEMKQKEQQLIQFEQPKPITNFNSNITNNVSYFNNSEIVNNHQIQFQSDSPISFISSDQFNNSQQKHPSENLEQQFNIQLQQQQKQKDGQTNQNDNIDNVKKSKEIVSSNWNANEEFLYKFDPISNNVQSDNQYYNESFQQAQKYPTDPHFQIHQNQNTSSHSSSNTIDEYQQIPDTQPSSSSPQKDEIFQFSKQENDENNSNNS